MRPTQTSRRRATMTDDFPSNPRPRWADRTFRFGHPTWMVLEFAERLWGTVPRLRALLEDVPNELMTHQVEGAWSMLQNAGHLGDVEELWLQRVEDLRAGRAAHSPARPDRFADLARGHQERTLDQTLQYVSERRAPFLEILVNADEALRAATAFHERLGTSMNLVDMAQFAAEHDDHHISRIRALRATLGCPLPLPRRPSY